MNEGQRWQSEVVPEWQALETLKGQLGQARSSSGSQGGGVPTDLCQACGPRRRARAEPCTSVWEPSLGCRVVLLR